MSNILIEIASTDVKTNSGTSSKGKPYTIRNQIAYMHKGEKYPEKFVISLGENQSPYPVGNYTLDANSFYVGQFDSLSVNPVLTEVKK